MIDQSMQPSESQKLNQSQIQVKINRLKSQKAVLENKLQATNKSLRKARTRHIQATVLHKSLFAVECCIKSQPMYKHLLDAI